MSCCPDPVRLQEEELETIVRTGDLASGIHDHFDGALEVDFLVPEMKCAACIRTLETSVKKVPGVSHVRANLTQKRLNIIWDRAKTDVAHLARIVEAEGYSVLPYEASALADTKDAVGGELLTSLAVSGFAAANVMLLSVSVWAGADHETAQLFHLISGCIAIPAVLFAGRPFFRPALKSLSAGRLNMDVPISLAVILALGFSVFETLSGGNRAYFDASVTLIFFLLIGRYLDHLMRSRAKGAAARLASLAAKGGLKIMPDDSIVYVPVDEILAGMKLRVPMGERFPVDSEVLSPFASVDRSFVTGESDPIDIPCGEIAEAGTVNVGSPVNVRAARTAKASFLAEMVRLASSAEEAKGAFVSIADRLAQVYAPLVHILALAAFCFWMVNSGGDWYVSLYSAIAVLIITCPCALGLAVPIVHVVAATRLFDDGVLMKDGGALERLADVKAAYFDKTGTLTTGLPNITGHEGDETDLAPALLLARYSQHPFSQGVARYLEALLPNSNPDIETVLGDVKETPGSGVEATVCGMRYRLGRSDWVREITPAETVMPLSNDGLAFGNEEGGFVAFRVSESLRDGALETVKEMQSLGLAPIILSGDKENRVGDIAQKLGIPDYQASMTPSEKLDEIIKTEEAGQNTIVIGDGLNDSAALAAGSVSIAPGSATDVSRLAADFVFTRESFSAVSLTLRVARATRWLVYENFALALGYNCVAIPLAFFGYITPLTAAIAMSVSSIVVVANSLRLKWMVGTS